MALIAAAAAVAAFTVGIHWGTFAAGGSDSSCYLNQARLFASGTTRIEQPLIVSAPWPRAEWTFTPAGHVPAPVRRGAVVPMCPPGLPLLMAAARLLHISEFIVVPLLGAIAVWLTFVLGRRLDGAVTGAWSAGLVACSPIFLYQIVQPMTDVPAAAWWLLAVALAIPDEGTHRVPPALAAGLATAMAILTRPNLLPLAIPIAIYLARLKPSPYGLPSPDDRSAPASPRSGFGEPRRSSRNEGASGGGKPSAKRPGAEHLAWFITGVAPGVVVLAILQWRMYGSPLSTGYGAPRDLFRASNIALNLARYPRWLLETHTPVLVVALAAPFVLRRRRAEAWLCLTIAIATIAAYLPYQVFNDWWYIRFLLPAIPLLVGLTVATIHATVGRRARGDCSATRTAAISAGFAVAVFVLCAWWIHVACERRAFELHDLERPYVDAGTFVAQRVSGAAAIVTVKDSGSVQYYAQRPTVSWDTLPPDALDRTLDFLRSRGLTPLLLFETAEEPQFRARFEAASAIGGLDWPPMARVGRTVRVYDPADRARYLEGATIQTIDIWPRRK